MKRKVFRKKPSYIYHYDFKKINDFIQVAFFKPCLDLFFLEIDEDDKEGDNNEDDTTSHDSKSCQENSSG